MLQHEGWCVPKCPLLGKNRAFCHLCYTRVSKGVGVPHASPGRPFSLSDPFFLGQYRSMVLQPSLHTCLGPKTTCDARELKTKRILTCLDKDLDLFFLSSKTNQTIETVHHAGDTPPSTWCEVFILGAGGSPVWWAPALCPWGPG